MGDRAGSLTSRQGGAVLPAHSSAYPSETQLQQVCLVEIWCVAWAAVFVVLGALPCACVTAAMGHLAVCMHACGCT